MDSPFSRATLALLLASGVLAGCASTQSTGDAPLNQRNWPWCSLLGGVVGGGLGSIESSAWAGGGAAGGAILGGLLCYAQDGDEDEDGVFDRRDRCPSTPKGVSVQHNGCPLAKYPEAPAAEAPATGDEVIVLSDLGEVLFAVNSDELTDGARAILNSVAERLKGAEVLGIEVTGHTDSSGAETYNQRLSERRARSVADYLIVQGVAADKLSTRGSGESQPVADNGSNAGRAQNRRVEIAVDR